MLTLKFIDSPDLIFSVWQRQSGPLNLSQLVRFGCREIFCALPNAEGGALHIGQGVKKSQQKYETDRYIHRWMDG
jgi:hypothetical protein